MFVPTPPLNHNGYVIVAPPYGYNIYQDGFSTFKAARDYNAGRTTINNGFHSYVERNFMQNGIVNGKKTVTPYYAFHLHMDYGKPYRQVIQYTEGGQTKYATLVLDCRVGYLGGLDTGLGSPHRMFTSAPIASQGSLNRAIADNAYNRAKVEVLSKARNQKLDLAETFVDLDKSLMMVAGRAGQVVKAMLAARRGNWPEVFKTLGLAKPKKLSDVFDSLSKGWLELNYGWMPLLNDIKSGVDFVNNGLKAGPEGTFSAHRRVSADLPFFALMDGGFNPWNNFKVTPKVTHDVKVRYDLRVSDPNLAFLSGIGLDNPAYLAWVGTPFSFVVDWLIPISPWLQGLTTPLGLTFIDGSISRRTSGTISIDLKRFYASSNARPIVLDDPQNVKVELLELTREKISSFPATLPYFRLPFSNPKRIVSAIALLQQLRSGR